MTDHQLDDIRKVERHSIYERNLRVKRMAELGMKPPAIAAVVGISETAVKLILGVRVTVAQHRRNAHRDGLIHEAYIGGMSAIDVGKKFNLTTQRVHQILNRFGVEKTHERGRGQRPSFTPEQQRDIVTRYAMGVPIARLARDFNKTEPTIVKVINQHGVKRVRQASDRVDADRPWSEDEIQFVVENADKMSRQQMANKLGRSRNEVSGKVWRLRKNGVIA